MSLPDADLPRREYLRGLVAAGGMAALSACVNTSGVDSESVPTGDPANRPARQHAWNEVLSRDEAGNIAPPEHHVLVALDLTGTPDETAREQVETAFRSLERAYAHGPDGLLFTVSYSPGYFERVGVASPIPEPEPLTSIESDVELDTFAAVVHLTTNPPSVVLEAEEALLGEVTKPNGIEMETDLTGVFAAADQRRTGFVGDGLPAQMAREHDIDVPDEMPEEAPFFMGFRSGFNASQAPEDRVTIQDGPYAGGTTMHIESLDLNLRQWFEQDDHFLRVAKMFSSGHANEERVGEMAKKLGTATGASEVAAETTEDARAEGIVGHAQKNARARDEDGTPPLLRRDFNTIDGDRPGVHFLAHQRSIDEFVRTRRLMAGEDVAGEGGVGRRLNNGILQYIFVMRRGNFLTPPRELRALPTAEREA
mgnify:CR=1 FL=1